MGRVPFFKAEEVGISTMGEGPLTGCLSMLTQLLLEHLLVPL